MPEYIDKVKKILETDPTIPGVAYLSSSTIPRTVAFLDQHPEYCYVSEWNDDLFGDRGFVKAHNAETGEYLTGFVGQGRLRKPTLLSVKSIDDLATMDKAA